MADEVIGTGVIQLEADTSGVKAGIDQTKRSVRDLSTELSASIGKSSKSAQRSIDAFIQREEIRTATIGKTVREAKLLEAAMRGARQDQLDRLGATLKVREAEEKSAAAMRATGAAATFARTSIASLVATAASVSFTSVITEQIAAVDAMNDLRDATGSSIANISAIDQVARRTGTTFETAASILVKFNQALKEAKAGSDTSRVIAELGLSVAELKRLDPAEALRRTSVALAKFADDGTKARAVQELFGKSIKDAAPLLVDLAEQSSLVGRVTSEQAEEAERLRKHIFELQTNLGDMARTVTLAVVPSINEMVRKLREGSEHAQGFWQTVFAYHRTVSSIQLDALGMRPDPLSEADLARIASLNKLLSEGMLTQSRRVFLERELKALMARQPAGTSGAGTSSAGPGRGFINPPLVRPQMDDVIGGKSDKDQLQAAVAMAATRLAAARSALQREADTSIAASARAAQLLEAQRSANLISEEEFYEERRRLLLSDSQAQQSAIAAEIKLLRTRGLIGKDADDIARMAIERDTEVAGLQAKALIAQADASAKLEGMEISRKGTILQLAQALKASAAAQGDYLSSLLRTKNAELAAIGLSDRARQDLQERLRIQEDYIRQRQALESDRRQSEFEGRFDGNARKRYEGELQLLRDSEAKALEIVEDGIARRRAAEENASVGASRAIQNYIENARNVADQTEQLYTSSFRSIEDELVSLATTGKFNFKSLADAIIADLVRIQIKSAMAKLFGGESGGGGFFDLLNFGISLYTGMSTPASTGGLGVDYSLPTSGVKLGGPRAGGGSVERGTLYPVNERGPELLNVGARQFLMMGSQRGTVTPNHAVGGGPVTIINQTRGRIDQVTEERMPNGERVLIIQEAVDAVGAQLNDPNSRISRSMGRNLNAPRKR